MANLDLEACAREPIHIPGLIQPHGALLAVDADDMVVVLASENVAAHLGRPLAGVLGARLGALIDPAAVAELERACRSNSLVAWKPGHVVAGAREFDAIVHRADDLLVLELEPHAADGDTRRDVFADACEGLLRMRRARTRDELWPIVVDEVRRITGFDRVMVYCFDERDEHGEVVAEALDPRCGRERYLGHNYPASDIPAQARRLYLLDELRLIPDVHYRPSRVLPEINPRTGKPLDMSRAVLRSVSPVHVEYLVNMGVSASMSVSLVHKERLAGLIACHHYAPRRVPYSVRLACTMLARVCSWMLAPLARAEAASHASRARDVLAGLARQMTAQPDLHSALLSGEPSLCDLVSAGGVALAYEGHIETRGVTPDREQLIAILRWLGARAPTGVVATDALPAEMPAAAEFAAVASGLLAVPLARTCCDCVLWFRPEWVRTVVWGGDPNKPAIAGPPPDRLHPRTSFAAWEETVRGRARPWATWEIEAAQALRVGLVDVVLEKSAEIRTLNASLKAAVRSRDDFLSVASHELRTPLTTLGVQLDSLRRACRKGQVTPEALVAKLDVAARQVERLDHLVGELLEVSRITAGRLDLRLADVDLVAVTRAAIERFEAAAAAVGATVTLHAPAPVHGRWDEFRLDQVVTNLLSNAIKYGGGSPIAVQVESIGRCAVLSVRDRGPGMPADATGRIFERFERAPTPGSAGGFGLGLWIVRQIVERHGGVIRVDSRLGVGSTFTVTLPREAPV